VKKPTIITATNLWIKLLRAVRMVGVDATSSEPSPEYLNHFFEGLADIVDEVEGEYENRFTFRRDGRTLSITLKLELRDEP
jgi:hypothetical protein